MVKTIETTDTYLRGVEMRPVPLRAAALLVLLATVSAVTGARLAAEPASTPRVDWLFDSSVNAVARLGNTLYVGGGFTGVAPNTSLLGTWVALSTTTGAVVPGLPFLDGAVYAVEPDGGGGYFLAGTFRNAGAGGLAHIRPDGTVDPVFRPQISASAAFAASTRLARVGPSLVFGGRGVPLRALDPITGAMSPWVPALPDPAVGPFAAANGRLFVMTGDTANNRRVTAFDGASGGVIWTSAVIGNAGGGFPDPTAGAMAIANGRIYVATSGLYVLDAATGAIDPVWGGAQTPSQSFGVDAMQVSGSALYFGGRFDTVRGQTRHNLAAVDVATGNLLPWNPDASQRIAALAAAPNGTVFVASQGTVGGVSRGSVFQIDAVGNVTTWMVQPVLTVAASLSISAAGDLLLGAVGFVVDQTTPPARLAAFDLTSGGLVPGAPVVTGSGPVGVSWLVSAGTTLFLSGWFDAVNGQPRQNIAAVDVASGTVLAWPAANAIPPNPFPVPRLQFVIGPWVYAYLSSDPGAPLQRIHATTGVVDPGWLAPVPPNGALTIAPVGADVLAVQRFDTGAIGAAPARAGVLDPVTGALIERSRFTVETPSVQFAVDGDTLYFVDPPWDVATGRQGVLRALDLNTGRNVQVPGVVGQLVGVALADGRLFPYGAGFTVEGVVRTWVAEVARPGAVTSWPPVAPGQVWALSVHGDRFVQVTSSGGFYRVRTFDLSGPAAPTTLRAHEVGGATVFSWSPTSPAPAGGYVIEGGFAPGRTAGALAVGSATSVALPMPAGPVFIRVRPRGSSEVSNEIVAGCVAPPLPPTALTTTLGGINLTLAWTAPSGPVTGYTLLAGTASGLRNVAALTLGPQTSVGGPVPGGTFFARVTASNACGTSGPSGEVFFTIGAPDALPAAPTSLISTVAGSTLTLSWTAPAGSVTGYVLEAGRAPGLANIGAVTIGAGTSFVIPGVPRGTYYVRVRAITSAGSGAPSSDATVVVP